jgi:hypothetical protein
MPNTNFHFQEPYFDRLANRFIPFLSGVSLAACFLVFRPLPLAAATTPDLPSKATTASTTWVIPSSANVSGAFGAYFKTKLTLFNPTSLSFNVSVSLFNDLGPVRTVVLPLQPSQSQTWDNFLDTVFTYTGAGALILDSSAAANSDYVFLVTAEVYADSSTGRYKTSVANGSAIDPIGSTNSAYNIGISVDSISRTNIGCFNNQSIPANVTVDILDSSGLILKTFGLLLNPKSWYQMSLSTAVSNGVIRWTSNGTIYAYAVVVDNTSNDGSYSVATEVSGSSGSGGGGGGGGRV